jgi:hypothetical protein
MNIGGTPIFSAQLSYAFNALPVHYPCFIYAHIFTKRYFKVPKQERTLDLCQTNIYIMLR